MKDQRYKRVIDRANRVFIIVILIAMTHQFGEYGSLLTYNQLIFKSRMAMLCSLIVELLDLSVNN